MSCIQELPGGSGRWHNKVLQPTGFAAGRLETELRMTGL
jgi:hypothetical protein